MYVVGEVGFISYVYLEQKDACFWNESGWVGKLKVLSFSGLLSFVFF